MMRKMGSITRLLSLACMGGFLLVQPAFGKALQGGRRREDGSGPARQSPGNAQKGARCLSMEMPTALFIAPSRWAR